MHLKTKLFDEQDSPTWSAWKNFQLTLEFKICSGRLLWVHGYPQKQTRWSHDAWSNFYGCRRAEMVLFSFWNSWSIKTSHWEPKWRKKMLFNEHDGWSCGTRRKKFPMLWPSICACKLQWDHIYPQNQTGLLYDTWFRIYISKRELVAIFWFWYFWKSRIPSYQESSSKTVR